MIDNVDIEIYKLMDSGTETEKGFKLLMTSYQRPLYYHLRAYLHDHNDIDDVLQNTFIKAYKHFGGFKRESALYSWLYRIATNEAKSFLSKKQRVEKGNNTVAKETFTSSAHDNIEGTLIRNKLDFAVSTLPDKQKEVFILRYFNEMPYEEMSSLLSTSVGALKASYHFAVKKIESQLTQSL